MSLSGKLWGGVKWTFALAAVGLGAIGLTLKGAWDATTIDDGRYERITFVHETFNRMYENLPFVNVDDETAKSIYDAVKEVRKKFDDREEIDRIVVPERL